MNELKENIKLIDNDLQKQLYDLKTKLIRTDEITDSVKIDLCNDVFEVEKLVNNLSLYLVMLSCNNDDKNNKNFISA